MITPPYLTKDDKIGIIAPARCINFDEVHPSIRVFQKWGLEVVLGTNIFRKCNQFAGKDEFRLADLQQMLDDDSMRAIICARGGYGTVRIVDQIDWTAFRRNPKWIVGYSDATVLHSHIHRHLGIETLHAIMPINITGDDGANDALNTLKNALFGKIKSYSYEVTPLARPGEAEGILTGGNLSILYSLMGSDSEADTTGKILFIEDVDEYLYHIDRMMMNLKRAGKLDKLAGLIVGGMDRMNDNTIPYGRSVNEIISDAVVEYNYPVCFDFPSGHGENNLALILGRNVKLKVGEEVELIFN
ncbi:MAG: LD-carboxypeptidase [Bacteroidetes bacterium]|nr:LD-carboxypeptidase [Bacteroidota bacterium]